MVKNLKNLNFFATKIFETWRNDPTDAEDFIENMMFSFQGTPFIPQNVGRCTVFFIKDYLFKDYNSY